MAITSPANTFSFDSESIILVPRSYIVSMSVVLIVSLPVFVAFMCVIAVRFEQLAKNSETYASQTPVDLDLHDFTLDDLSLFLDPNTNTPPQRLREGLRFRHGQREDLASSDYRKGHILSQRLSHPYSADLVSHGSPSPTRELG